MQKPESKIQIPVLLGPTGVGKTGLVVAIAGEIGAEVISCDSRQVYRFMDIGTAKPTKGEQGRVRHHLIDVADPDETYNAGRYAREALEVIARLSGKGKPFWVVAGTGLYLQALLKGFFDAPVISPKVRRRVAAEAEVLGQAVMHERLKKVDPESGSRIHPHDPQRTLRALEVYEATGKSLSEWWRNGRTVRKDYNPLLVGMTRPRDVLYDRIDKRVEEMIGKGLVEECRSLLRRGYSPELNSLRTLGYREAFEHLEGKRDLPATVALIQKNTRNYAKRQMTWFRRETDVEWLDAEALSGQDIRDKVLQRWGM